MSIEQLEVGDKVTTTNCFQRSEYVISRVTKTLAKSRRADGYEHTFKRHISGNMSHPSQSYCLTRYAVEKAKS